MDDNPWDSVTRLGKSRSGGGVEREKVAKGKAAINAAMRNGKVLYTEKKVGSANSRPNPQGQRDRKVDEADAPVPVAKNDLSVATVVQREMTRQGYNLSSLALKTNKFKAGDISKVLQPNAPKPPQELINKLQNILGVKLSGSDIGQLNDVGRRMAKEAAKAEAAKKAAEAAQGADAEDAEDADDAERGEGAEAEAAEGADGEGKAEAAM